MDIVRELYNLPAIVPKQEYLEWYQKIEQQGKKKLWKVFSIMDIYGTFYNRNKEIG